MFSHIIKHLNARQKNSAARRIFNSLLVFRNVVKDDRLCLIYYIRDNRECLMFPHTCQTYASTIIHLYFFRAISYNVWVHVAATWSQVNRIAKIFIDGIETASKSANAGLSSYEIMSNSHTYYQVGVKKDSSETFYGFVRDLKVFKRLLTANEIMQEAGRLPC